MSLPKSKGRFVPIYYKGFAFPKLGGPQLQQEPMCAQHLPGPLHAPPWHVEARETDANVKLTMHEKKVLCL